MVSTFCEYFCFRKSFISYSISVWTVSASFRCLLIWPQYRMKVQFTFPFCMPGQLLNSTPFTIQKAEHWLMLLNCGVEDHSCRRLESPLDCKEINQVDPKGNQSWILIGRIDSEAEAPVLRPSHGKNWLIGKDLDAGKDWRWEEKRTTEDEMVGWHHWLDGHEFEQAPGVGDGQGGLVCCGPWGLKESAWLSNWTELNYLFKIWNVDTRNIFGFLIER